MNWQKPQETINRDHGYDISAKDKTCAFNFRRNINKWTGLKGKT